MRLDVKRLRHLLAVASCPTVQEAADGLHLTQSALTKSIQRLEEDLDAPLFDRTGHRLSLTELGEHLVMRADEILRHVNALEDEIALWKGLATGNVNIGVDPVAELGLMPPVLTAFLTAHPAIQTSLRSGQTETLLPALRAGELHFLVADPELAQHQEDLDVCPLVASPLVAATRPGHPLANNLQPTPEQLSDYPRIGGTTAPRFTLWREERDQLAGSRSLARSLTSENYGLLIQLAETSDAIVFGPKQLLERFGRLRIAPWPLQSPTTESSLIRMRRRNLSPAAEALIDMIVETSESSTGTGGLHDRTNT